MTSLIILFLPQVKKHNFLYLFTEFYAAEIMDCMAGLFLENTDLFEYKFEVKNDS